MTKKCKKIKELLASGDLEKIHSKSSLMQHLMSCEECKQAQAEFEQLNSLVNQLPEFSASDELIDTVVSKAEVTTQESKVILRLITFKDLIISILKKVFTPSGTNSWFRIAASAAVIMIVVRLSFVDHQQAFYKTPAYRGSDDVNAGHFRSLPETKVEQLNAPAKSFPQVKEMEEKVISGNYKQNLDAGFAGRTKKKGQRRVAADESILNRYQVMNQVIVQQRAYGGKDSKNEGLFKSKEARIDKLSSSKSLGVGSTLSERVARKPKSDERRREGFDYDDAFIEDELVDGESDAPSSFLPDITSVGRDIAELAEKKERKKLSFKNASGYWSNTYIPGDPVLRRLQTYYDNIDSASPVKLTHNARRTTQPFDLPSDAALGLYLHSNVTYAEGKQRMLLQVGIQGTKRLGRYRGPMNMGLVIDLRDRSDVEYIRNVRALIRAFEKEKLTGDQFSLTVIGHGGGVLIRPEEFKHGMITLTLQELFEKDNLKKEPTDIYDGLISAYNSVSSKDDPTSPLGSSTLLFVTNNNLNVNTESLAPMIHEQAVNGISLSVIGYGNNINLDDLDFLALSGQGTRRIMKHAGEALELANKELNAVSNVVARAIRLRIRLAPGVKLIDIYGSEQQDEIRSNRTREAEKSIDLRLSRNLGITADRGEDEEGIQIVIPAFYANDSHVFLLDLLAPGAGAVADAQIRYKDLVHLKNNSNFVNFSLSNQPKALGPLEYNVIKNQMAYDLSKSLERTAEIIEDGYSIQDAENSIANEIDKIAQTQEKFAGLQGDLDLSNDLSMLNELQQAVTSTAQGRSSREDVSNTMRLSGKLKTVSNIE